MSTAQSNHDGKYVARTVLSVFGALGATLLAVIWSVIWLVTTGIDAWPSFGVMAAIVLLFVAPVILFALVGNWSFEPSREGSRYLVRAYSITGGVALLCAATIIGYGIATQPWTWLPVSSVIIGAAFFAVAIVLGRALRSAAPPLVPGQAPGGLELEAWTPAPRSRPGVAAIVTVGVFAIFAGLASLAFHPWSPIGDAGYRRHYVLSMSLEVLAIGLIAAGVATLCFSFRALSRPARTIRRNFVLRKRVLRAIAKGDASGLDPVELEAARRYASDSGAAGIWAAVLYSLIGIGLSLQQISAGLQPYSPFGPWFGVGLFVLYMVVVALWAVRWRRAVRFLRVNGRPTGQPIAEPTPVAPVG